MKEGEQTSDEYCCVPDTVMLTFYYINLFGTHEKFVR